VSQQPSVSHRVVLRPRRARLVVYPAAAALFVVLVGVAFLMPSGGAHGWGTGSRLAVVVFAALHDLWARRRGAYRPPELWEAARAERRSKGRPFRLRGAGPKEPPSQ